MGTVYVGIGTDVSLPITLPIASMRLPDLMMTARYYCPPWQGC